jgi:hypothetical protein
VGIALLLIGSLPFLRFLYLFIEGSTEGHVQSLLIGGAFLFAGGQLIVLGLLARAIAWNRQLVEDVLYRLRDEPRASPVRPLRSASALARELEFEKEERSAVV